MGGGADQLVPLGFEGQEGAVLEPGGIGNKYEQETCQGSGKGLDVYFASQTHHNHLVRMLPSDLSFRACVWRFASVTDMVVFHLEPEFKSQPLSGEGGCLLVSPPRTFPSRGSGY